MRRALPLLLFVACGSRSELDVPYPFDASIDAAHDAPHDAPRDVPGDVMGDAPADAPHDAGVDASDAADASDASDGQVPLLTLSVVGMGADRTSKADQGIAPDGFQDGYFSATAVGAFDALILVTTSNGQPAYGQEWDTLVLQDPIPPFGFSFTYGAQTWVLAVWENGQRVSDTACRISLAPGTHVLELTGSDSGWFHTGVTFKLWGRLGGSWYTSNVATWP